MACKLLHDTENDVCQDICRRNAYCGLVLANCPRELKAQLDCSVSNVSEPAVPSAKVACFLSMGASCTVFDQLQSELRMMNG